MRVRIADDNFANALPKNEQDGQQAVLIENNESNDGKNEKFRINNAEKWTIRQEAAT